MPDFQWIRETNELVHPEFKVLDHGDHAPCRGTLGSALKWYQDKVAKHGNDVLFEEDPDNFDCVIYRPKTVEELAAEQAEKEDAAKAKRRAQYEQLKAEFET